MKWIKIGLFSLIMTLLTAGLMFIVVYQVLPDKPWEELELGKSGKEQTYCELNLMNEVVRQPSNSWSNLIFAFLGFAVLGHHWFRRKEGSYGLSSPVSIWIAASFLLMCFGSFFFHASLTRLGQRFDMTFVYGLMIALITSTISILLMKKKISAWFWLGLMVLMDVVMFIIKWQMDAWLVLPGMVMTQTVLCIILLRAHLIRRQVITVIGGAGVTIMAFSFLLLDFSKFNCDPHSWLQGHAAWHFCAATGAFLVYLFLEEYGQFFRKKLKIRQ